MALFGSDVDRPRYARGVAPGLRCTLYAILSVALMVSDAHGRFTQRIHYALEAAAYPLQLAVSSPATAWSWVNADVRTRLQLQHQVADLQQQVRTLQIAVLRQAALERENAELRGLKAALPPLIHDWQLAEVIGLDNALHQRIVVNRGAHAGVTMNQTVIDANGVLGQVARVGPWSAEVILLTDPEHAIPVVVTRTQQRAIATGGGNGGELLLPDLPANADLKDGDLLVTSGLGGVFPAGLPVGVIALDRRGAHAGPAHVRPLGRADHDREVMLLRFEPAHPAAPAPTPPIEPASPLPHPAARPARTSAEDP